jgi:hypothetical protein
MKFLPTLIFLVSFCFGQGYYYHVLDEVEYYDGTSTTPHPDAIRLSSNRLIIVYGASSGNVQVLASYSYNAGFELTKLDTLITGDTIGAGVSLARIDDTHFFAYQDRNATGHAKTFSIDGSGVITRMDSISVGAVTNGRVSRSTMLNDTTVAVIMGRANDWEGTAQFDVDLSTYDVTQIETQHIDETGVSLSNDIAGFGDGTKAVLFWRDAAYDLALQTIGYDGSWLGTLIGSQLIVNINTIHHAFVLMNDTTAIVATDYVTNRVYATYYVIEWDADGSNISTPDYVEGLVKVDGFPALHRYNNTTVIALNGALGDTSAIESLSLDGTNQITANNDRIEWHPAGIVRPDDIWVEAFDDSTICAIYTDTDNDMWLTTIRISTIGTPPSFGWAHSVSGVSTPTAVNSASTFTKVSGVE